MIKNIKNNRNLIWSLAKNDFKQKFAGSNFGIVWAFVQPVITILVYWIVFDKALNAGTQGTKEGIAAPFVLWLTCGIVPWFYFSEVISAGTNVLIEYNYLVKKVVFNIDVLPIVKAVSSIFVHLFFVAFAFILCIAYGFVPGLSMVQFIYYSFAMMVLTIGLIYASSAMVVFFRDLSQLINIVLQVGIWATPIMWNFETVADKMPGWLSVILKLNPMFYIVQGYRESLIYGRWFWEHPLQSLYFWTFAIVMLVVGSRVFGKLKSQFADVL